MDYQQYAREKREREWKQKVLAQKASMGNAQRVERATEWKRLGNEKFKAGNFFEACDYYREGILYVEDLVDARRKERDDLLVPLYTNLAQVQLKLSDPALAEESASKALSIVDIPRNGFHPSFRAKALFRRALARRALGRLEHARDDLVVAARLQPESEEVGRELDAVRSILAEQQRQEREAMAGFLNRQADNRRDREQRQRQQEEKRRQAEERRLERRARAEQRQQMQAAFAKLSQGEMLYEAREREMGPIRQKEKEKQQTLELEQKLLNVIDGSKGLQPTTDFEEFMKQKETRCEEQAAELDQKKKVLDKLKKEKQWEEDDVWRNQRDEHRRRLEAERATTAQLGPRPMWESKEVARWCEQRLRDMLLGSFVESAELDPALAATARGEEEANCRDCLLRGIITDVAKLHGDAAVVKLNPQRPPLHYFDYFVKLDWEVTVVRRGQRAYRTADELIQVAAEVDDGKAPPSVTEHSLSSGTFKIREFCSEEAPQDGMWQLQAKVKKPCKFGTPLPSLVDEMQDRLKVKVEHLLQTWVSEFREHWA